MNKKAEEQGKFETISDLVDSRSQEEKGGKQLHQGFSVFAGNRGSKLSGGQK